MSRGPSQAIVVWSIIAILLPIVQVPPGTANYFQFIRPKTLLLPLSPGISGIPGFVSCLKCSADQVTSKWYFFGLPWVLIQLEWESIFREFQLLCVFAHCLQINQVIQVVRKRDAFSQFFCPPKEVLFCWCDKLKLWLRFQGQVSSLQFCINLIVHQAKKIALSSIDIRYGWSCVYLNNAWMHGIYFQSCSFGYRWSRHQLSWWTEELGWWQGL